MPRRAHNKRQGHAKARFGSTRAAERPWDPTAESRRSGSVGSIVTGWVCRLNPRHGPMNLIHWMRRWSRLRASDRSFARVFSALRIPRLRRERRMQTRRAGRLLWRTEGRMRDKSRHMSLQLTSPEGRRNAFLAISRIPGHTIRTIGDYISDLGPKPGRPRAQKGPWEKKLH